MNKEEVNKRLKWQVGYTNDEDIQELRDIYKNIVSPISEEDFYNSVISWFFDGNAPYYDNYLRKVWVA